MYMPPQENKHTNSKCIFPHLVHFTQGGKKTINRKYVLFPVHVIPEKQKWIHFTMGTCLQMLEIKAFFMDHQISYNDRVEFLIKIRCSYVLDKRNTNKTKTSL